MSVPFPLDFVLSAVVTLLVVVDPIGLLPIFVSLTGGLTAADRRAVAIRAVVIAAGTLAGCALIGDVFLRQLGISLPAFRIAGGLLLFAIAFEMVYERRNPRQARAARQAVQSEPVSREHISYLAAFPLAIPLLAGPGAITAVLLLAGKATGQPTLLAILLGVIAAVALLCLGAFFLADRFSQALGMAGNLVLSRLLGIVLAALAVQYVLDGVRLAFLT